MASEQEELTKEQKEFVDKNWKKLKLPDLVRGTFNDPSLDGRSSRAELIQKHLSRSGKRAESTFRGKKRSVNLTDEQKKIIEKNARHTKILELTRLTFGDFSLSIGSAELDAVKNYVNSLPYDITGIPDNDIVDDYRGPATLPQTVAKVNLALLTEYNADKMNSQQKGHFETIKKFLKSPRFLQMINSYSTKQSRIIFEQEFIRNIFDKPDLTSDELNLSINLCANYVNMITINRQLEALNERYDTVIADPDSKISMVLAEMIKVKTGELNQCDKRQQDLIKDLQGSRAERNKNKKEKDISVADLLAWWANEESRKAQIKREELRKKLVSDELERLDNFDALKCSILGFSKSELLYSP